MTKNTDKAYKWDFSHNRTSWKQEREATLPFTQTARGLLPRPLTITRMQVAVTHFQVERPNAKNLMWTFEWQKHCRYLNHWVFFPIYPLIYKIAMSTRGDPNLKCFITSVSIYFSIWIRSISLNDDVTMIVLCKHSTNLVTVT